MFEVAVVGGGGHARVLVSIARRDAAFSLIGYLDLQDRDHHDWLPYLGSDEAFHASYAGCRLLMGVGLMLDARVRWRLFEFHRSSGAAFVRLVSSRACVAPDARIGDGSVVMDLAALNTGAVLGEACIVNTGAVVEHDCTLGNNVHVAPGATLCGNARIGDHCLIGAGATVLPGVCVSPGTIVGAGAVVTASTEGPGRYFGVPARRRGEGMPT